MNSGSSIWFETPQATFYNANELWKWEKISIHWVNPLQNKFHITVEEIISV